MDPISIIVAALVAGTADAVKKNASQAISDAYHAFKNLVITKWTQAGDQNDTQKKQAEAEVMLEQLEANPETFKPLFEKKLKSVLPQADPQLLEQAAAFSEMLKQAGLSTSINVSDSQGVQIGDGNTQNITFN